MRVLLLIVAAALLAPAAAQAAPPEGFRDTPKLTVRAERLASVPDVAVYCATSRVAWVAFVRERLRKPEWQTVTELGLTDIETREMYLAPNVCRTLHAKLAGRRVVMRTFAYHLFVLTHEAMHARGIANEQRADCAALRRYSFAARQFSVRATTRVSAMRRTLAGRTWCS